MREIFVSEIIDTVEKLCMDANYYLNKDIRDALEKSLVTEESEICRAVLKELVENANVASNLQVPMCQDTGMAVVFAEIGQDVHITGGLFNDAVNKGVAKGYTEGLLRCSVVADPLRRVNTNDNTPAIIHTTLVEGDRIKLTVATKGFGSENMSRIRMFTPAAKYEDIISFICETAKLAESNACPPMVLGVGIGGDFEMCALLAKKALCRPLDIPNSDPFYAKMENDALEAVNKLDIGPQGFGGKSTALGVSIEVFPTHIAGLPVAVNVGCHVTRHASCIL